jgi:LPS-assembly lipoprotein
MSSSDRISRRRLLAAMVVLPLLSGCSFTPLYGTNSAVETGPGFAYAEPTNRYEQIIYQELAFRLGTDNSPDATKVTVSASGSTRRVGRTSPGSVLTAYEAVITAGMKVEKPGAEDEILMNINRFASASYEISGQVVADRAATENAKEVASKSLADTLRLILSAARNKGDI